MKAEQAPVVKSGPGDAIELSVAEGRKIKATSRRLSLANLKLDPANVRFKHVPVVLTDEQMEEKIWAEPDTRDLFREILHSRGLSEPVLVNFSHSVKEGNRRLVCLRKLSERAHAGELPGIAEDVFDQVQCIVLPADVADKDIAILLTRYHVTGKKTWRAVNKAAHVFDLYEKYGMGYDEIRNLVSIGKAQAIRMVNAFKATKRYGEKYPSENDGDWLEKYSYFDELYKRREYKEWRENEEKVEAFMDWIHSGKLTRGEDVRLLKQAIDDPTAFEVFEEKGIVAAREVIAERNPAITNKLYADIDRAIALLRKFPRDELMEAAEDGAKLAKLKELATTAESVLKDVERFAKGARAA